MSVASLTDQRSVAAWPRSTVDGSAANVAIDGLGGGGAGFSGGGVVGGGGGATFFLHPAAIKKREKPNKIAPILRLFIVNFAS